ncbi:transmembrane protein 45B-like protein [Cinnamomum micranthum f. kanehirae]|uniref:Transmembrane protein 45B-like protein n=1 Tax=Cinnamomum micranthum f. kanehirae TaxID=337451 RepID=A0A3S3M8K2_9MAGN|nr:transmembrane protein 45B-like protein [Cinnamomum micranthum f. kanehirae]
MGTLIGHVGPGFGFFLIGLWQLFNHIKSHSLNPNSYKSLPWFPTSLHRYLELFLIMGGTTISMAMELFIGPDRHQPFDPDWTIPSNHLHNFEHALISFTFFTYAAFAIAFDSLKLKARDDLTQLLTALAFGQQLLLFHLHSADHMGVEGQYHLLLQLVVLVSIVTTLLGVALPTSFLVSFIRSLSILFQGVWFIVMGFMLWTPGLIPKGCRMNYEEGHFVVRCESERALNRAKSLVNLQFGWCFVCVAIFSMIFYVYLLRRYEEKVEYRSLHADDDMESQKNKEEYQSFVQMGKGMPPMNIER